MTIVEPVQRIYQLPPGQALQFLLTGLAPSRLLFGEGMEKALVTQPIVCRFTILT